MALGRACGSGELTLWSLFTPQTGSAGHGLRLWAGTQPGGHGHEAVAAHAELLGDQETRRFLSSHRTSVSFTTFLSTIVETKVFGQIGLSLSLALAVAVFSQRTEMSLVPAVVPGEGVPRRLWEHMQGDGPVGRPLSSGRLSSGCSW